MPNKFKSNKQREFYFATHKKGQVQSPYSKGSSLKLPPKQNLIPKEPEIEPIQMGTNPKLSGFAKLKKKLKKGY